MYSYLFIYIYVLQVYTLTGVLSLIYLTCYGSCIVVFNILCHLGLSNDGPQMLATCTGISVISSVTFVVSPYCSIPEMLYVKVF